MKARDAAHAEKLRKQARDRYAKNPQRMIANQMRYAARHSERVQAVAARRDPVAHRASSWKAQLKTYGLTVVEYEHLYTVQRGLCAVCHRPETVKGRSGKPRRLGVDHCHETGRVRALLCHACNVVIGLLTADQLRVAADYLEEQALIKEELHV